MRRRQALCLRHTTVQYLTASKDLKIEHQREVPHHQQLPKATSESPQRQSSSQAQLSPSFFTPPWVDLPLGQKVCYPFRSSNRLQRPRVHRLIIFSLTRLCHIRRPRSDFPRG